MSLVLYIDMDSFFASCELLRHKEYIGKPLVIGTSEEKDKDRGVVQTCTYEARKFGIKSGMPIVQAYKLCKELVYIASDEKYYEDVSKRIFALLRGYGRPVEQYSIDEAAIDIEGLDYNNALSMGKELKGRIADDVGLKCTIGISHGKYIAKMVCESAKPDGLKLLKKEEIVPFLAGKAIEEIPGVGPKTASKLHSMGIDTIDKIGSVDVQLLSKATGSFGAELHNIAVGDDRSRVVESSEALSISRERTLERNTTDIKDVYAMADRLVEEVHGDVEKKNVLFKGVGVKIKYDDFTYVTRSTLLKNYSQSKEQIASIARKLFERNFDAKKPIRKIGVKVYSLSKVSGQKRLT